MLPGPGSGPGRSTILLSAVVTEKLFKNKVFCFVDQVVVLKSR